MPDSKCIYHKKSFNAVKKHIPIILTTAKILEITPQSIFGAMIEEHHDYSDNRLANVLLDLNVIALTQYRHKIILKYFNKIKNPDEIYSIKDKIKNPILNDISSYNIKIATTINLLETYLHTFKQDLLGLKVYQDNYGTLVKDMMNEKEIIPKIAGLMLYEAKNYFAPKVDKIWWDAQNQNYKDALYITYYNMGYKTINDKYQQCIQQALPYRPQLGLGKAAGVNHLFNISLINQYF